MNSAFASLRPMTAGFWTRRRRLQLPPVSDTLPAIEIEDVRPERTAAFRRAHEREALSTAWNFRVVWHEQRHELAATAGGDIAGVLGLRIAASPAQKKWRIITIATR